MKLVSTKFTDLVPVEEFNNKPIVMYDGGLPRLELGEKWASSLPLEQVPLPPEKSLGELWCP